MQFQRPSFGIFKRMLLSYLLILFLPLIIGSLLYQRSVNIVKNQAVELSLTTQSNAIIYIDNYLREMENLSLQFYLDREISALQEIDPERLDVTDMSKLLSAKNKKDSYYIDDTFSSRYFLFFTKSGVIFNKNRITADPSIFFKEFFQYENLTYAEWHDQLMNLRTVSNIPMQTILTDGTEYRAFTYLIPIRYQENSYAILSVLFEESLIRQIFGIQNETLQHLCILDAKQNPIYNSQMDFAIDLQQLTENHGYFMTDINGESSLVVYSTSNYNNWTYLSIFPSDLLLHPVHQIRSITILIFFVTLIIGIIGSIFLTKRTADPIRSVLSLLQDHTQKSRDRSSQDEMRLIQSAVDNLIHNNQQVKNSLSEQNQILNALFIDRILDGTTTFSSDDIRNFNENLQKLYHTSLTLTVLALQYDPPSDHESWDSLSCMKATAILCDAIAKQMEPAFYCSHFYRSNQLVLLLGEPNAYSDHSLFVESYIKNLLSVLTEPFNRRIRIGIGNPCTCIADICSAYKEALEAVYYLEKHKDPRQFFWRKDIPITSNTFYYTVDQEKKLINNIKSGNVNEVQSICDNLYIENFMENQITYAMKICFLFNFYCTAIKVEAPSQLLSDEIRMEFSDLTQRYHQDTDRIFSILSQRILSLSDQFLKNKRDSSPQIGEQFKQYIESHFAEDSLDTSRIAAEFHLSEGYFSHLFKEQCGETFSDYLEQFRISKACKLLSQSDYTITMVSTLVGYSNVYTFRRAFKRVLGILPTQYREQ
ncbi:MAG: helix-turn-helix domain-containing protein [Candidatus Merdivicinus sp.]